MKVFKVSLWLLSLVTGLALVSALSFWGNSAQAEVAAGICDADGYWINNHNHPVEWSGRLIGTMVSGAEIGLETVRGTNYPVFDVYLGDELNIEKSLPGVTYNDVIVVKGYWQGIDCELYRSIYGNNCVPLIEATEISPAN